MVKILFALARVYCVREWYGCSGAPFLSLAWVWGVWLRVVFCAWDAFGCYRSPAGSAMAGEGRHACLVATGATGTAGWTDALATRMRAATPGSNSYLPVQNVDTDADGDADRIVAPTMRSKRNTYFINEHSNTNPDVDIYYDNETS